MPEYRHTVGSTTSKTGPVPPTFPTEADILTHDDRFGQAANRSVTRIKNYHTRRQERIEAQEEEEE